MTTLHLTRGIPASGKTTWAKAWLAEGLENGDDRIRLNRDDLRQMLKGRRSGLLWVDEERITTVQHDTAREALARGFDVVVDDMNLRARYVRAWLALAEAVGATVEIHDFPIELGDAIARDVLREHPVGAAALAGIYDRFTRKGVLPEVPTEPEPDKHAGLVPYVPLPDKTQAYIFDIDGTLAHIPEGGRSPYDGTRVHEDVLDDNVAHVMRALAADHYLIVMSGRDAKYQAATVDWLEANRVQYDELHMRPEGDTRKDQVVKAELFDAHVRHRFNVFGVFDDRDRVVAMWRALGLTTYQVAEGAF
ncbi:AAA family ATPase [Frigoribacterium sp. VKM Ac-2530]|uniref:phosphatase domain-containing protein n=1 Tax=Frigoribacterium sp. VKM Ac-2530 TaxID=2783822 RepID=UPI00188A62BF|nr:AAA family ATPase [Frigoribacterium sp. VKM Ac-2530]